MSDSAVCLILDAVFINGAKASVFWEGSRGDRDLLIFIVGCRQMGHYLNTEIHGRRGWNYSLCCITYISSTIRKLMIFVSNTSIEARMQILDHFQEYK